MGKNIQGKVPKTKVGPKIVEEKLLFKKSQTRLLQELTAKHQKEIEVVINEILEDEGMKDKIKTAVKTTLMPGFEGIVVFTEKDSKDKIGG